MWRRTRHEEGPEAASVRSQGAQDPRSRAEGCPPASFVAAGNGDQPAPAARRGMITLVRAPGSGAAPESHCLSRPRRFRARTARRCTIARRSSSQRHERNAPRVLLHRRSQRSSAFGPRVCTTTCTPPWSARRGIAATVEAGCVHPRGAVHYPEQYNAARLVAGVHGVRTDG